MTEPASPTPVPASPVYALMSSGGKDSTLALDRARRQGMEVKYLINIYDGDTGRVAFHGVRTELIAAQAEAMGLEHLPAHTGPDRPYETVFLETVNAMAAGGMTGVIFGNVHLADVRAWFEERVTQAGLEHVEPLWGEDPWDLVRETVDRGFRAVVVSVDLEQHAEPLLGMTLDDEFLGAIAHAPTIDPCGERGEYHTYVHDGPTFAHPVPFTRGEIRKEKNHHLLDLVPVAEPS